MPIVRAEYIGNGEGYMLQRVGQWGEQIRNTKKLTMNIRKKSM